MDKNKRLKSLELMILLNIGKGHFLFYNNNNI